MATCEMVYIFEGEVERGCVIGYEIRFCCLAGESELVGGFDVIHAG